MTGGLLLEELLLETLLLVAVSLLSVSEGFEGSEGTLEEPWLVLSGSDGRLDVTSLSPQADRRTVSITHIAKNDMCLFKNISVSSRFYYMLILYSKIAVLSIRINFRAPP